MSDILIIGGGLAGWRAAEAAVDRGCSVTLVANGDGNSPHIHALNCPVLPGDSAERMFEDTMASGHGTNDPVLVRVLCEGAVKLKDEFDFDKDENGEYLTIQPLGSSVPRCVSIGHAIGAWELRRIQTKLKGKIEVVNGRVTEIRREDGFYVARASSPLQKVLWSGRPRPDSYPPSYFPGFDHVAFSSVKSYRGEALPHWDLKGAIYHVVFRLNDSIPADVYAAWNEERNDLKLRAAKFPLSKEESERLHWLTSECADHYLDEGLGECLLKIPEVADVVSSVLLRGNGSAYYLHAVGLMPNHLHLILQLSDDRQLDKVIQGVKGSIAHCANSILGRRGVFWQSDYYNHIIRTYEEYNRQVAYVGVKNAGVFGWRLGIGLTCGWNCQYVELDGIVCGKVDGTVCGKVNGTVCGKVNETVCGKVDGTVCGKGVPALANEKNGRARTPCPQVKSYVARASSPLQKTEYIHSRAIVLATGGWCGKYDFSTNPPYLRGDGIALAESLGAATRDMDAVQYEPTVRVEGPRRGVPVITTLLNKGATLRNMRGEEFVQDVRVNKDELSRKILEEIKSDVCGKGVLALASGVTNGICGKGVPALAEGKTGRARTPCPQVKPYVARASSPLQAVIYDLSRVAAADLLACKMDPDERRILVAPAAHTSLGGVVIDTECRVLRGDGSPIPGLFAAGEVTGGLHGHNRLGGNAGTEVMVFGKIAGESASKYVHENEKGSE